MLSTRSRLCRILFFLPLILSLFLGTISCAAKAAAFTPLTVLSIVGGNVEIQQPGTSSWTDGKEGITLETGDKVKTDPGATATITFFDGSTIELNSSTEISLDELLSKSSTSPKTIKIGQTIGETSSSVVKLVDPASRYEVDTQAGVAAVGGSKMVVTVATDGTTGVYNLEGIISFTAQGQEAMIPVGSVSSATPGQVPSTPEPGTPPIINAAGVTSISSQIGWQRTGLYLNVGDKFYVDYRGGSWTVDYKNFPHVGPGGYTTDVDKTIAPGYKFDASLPYGYLLGEVGGGKDIRIGNNSGPFTADASGFLSLRINDSDATLGDNDGAITVQLQGGSTQTTTTNVNSGSNNIALNVPVTGSGGFNYTQGSYLEGFEFTANSAISITQLGAYDSNYSHLPNGAETFSPVEVAVYDLTTNTQLGSVTVKASDPVTGVCHYAPLARSILLNMTDNYAVVWASGTNYYLAAPTLTQTDVNSVITYVGFVGYGPGGLTQTSEMVEPDWFFSEANNGLSALNYDIGPNFMFVVN
jgi:FecR protein